MDETIAEASLSGMMSCIAKVGWRKMFSIGDRLMKSYREELWFETKTRRAYLNITPQIETAVRKSGGGGGIGVGQRHAYHGECVYQRR